MKLATVKEHRKVRQARMAACMKKAKTEKQKNRCKRIHTNIFDPPSEEQKAKQDSTLKSWFKAFQPKGKKKDKKPKS